MSEQKPDVEIRQIITIIPDNRAGDTRADATRATLAQQGIQPADVADAVTWVRPSVDTQHDQRDDDSAASIKP